jgi:tRNA(Arg) A34 adenosine deaminase TadA
MCLSAVYWARLDRLVYAATRKDAATAGFDDDFIYKEIPLEDDKRSLKCEHIDCQTASLPFDAWREKSDKTEY